MFSLPIFALLMCFLCVVYSSEPEYVADNGLSMRVGVADALVLPAYVGSRALLLEWP
jgi:hypothetical protein